MDAVGEGRPEGLSEGAFQLPKIIPNTLKISARSAQEPQQPPKKLTAGASMDAVISVSWDVNPLDSKSIGFSVRDCISSFWSKIVELV